MTYACGLCVQRRILSAAPASAECNSARHRLKIYVPRSAYSRQRISETTVAGFPRTNVFGATLSNTTLPAETTAPEPISTPGAIKHAAAIQLPSRTLIGATRSLKSSRRKSWLPVQRYPRWLMQTFDSIVTGASVRIPTSSPIQTWSPIVSRHGKEMFTFARITTLRPIFAPNARSSTQRKDDGHGKAFWKKRKRTSTQTASFHRGAPRSKSLLS